MAIQKEVARRMLPLVNSVEFRLLSEYINYKIELHRNGLENSNSHEFTLKSQGAIQELRRFLTLREEVIANSKEEN